MKRRSFLRSLTDLLRPRTKVRIHRIRDAKAYASYRARFCEELSRRRAIERSLAEKGSSFDVPGFCYVCRESVSYPVDYEYAYEVEGILTPNWRERLVCPRCHLNNRMRAAVHVLAQECGVRAEDPVYVTEQTTPLFGVLRSRYPNAVGSEFLGRAIALGASDSRGVRNEDLSRLTFPDESFEAILSFDVLEHVPDFTAGLAECYRCLRPAGIFLFSVPFQFDRERNVVRARVEADGGITHCLPPEYHGDPLCREGVLCFHVFGWELLDRVRDVGFEGVSALLYWSREQGYLGDPQYLFVAFKPRSARRGYGSGKAGDA